MAQREVSENGAGSFLSIILLGAGIGGVVYLAVKYFGVPKLPSTAVPLTGIGVPPGGPGLGGNHPGSAPTPPPALVALLRSNPTARKVFLFQASMYSYFQTDALPDGQIGPVTRAMVAKVNRALNPMDSSTVLDDGVLQRLGSALRTLTNTHQGDASQARVRILPGTLPQDVIDQVNAAGLAVASDVPPLQIMAG
jgi:hypothetical protein